MISGAGRMPESAKPSRNWPSLSHPRPTASPRTKGIAVYAPPKVRSPALRPDRNKAVAVTDLINRE